MAKNEKTSASVSKVAAQGLKSPSSLSNAQIRKVCGSALTQTPDKAKRR